MNVYNAAVIGLGRIGFGFDEDPKRKYIATHCGAYSYLNKTRLVAVSDIDKKKVEACKARWNIPAGYTDMREMMEKEKIDVVSICTPPKSHYQVLRNIIPYPLKAVFCEKPLASSAEDAKEMVSLCKKKGIILQVDHQRRFDALHIKLSRFIRDKRWGDVQQANFYYTAGINNSGSHMFDLLRLFFGEVSSVQASFSKNFSGRDNDPNLDGILEFDSGLLATFQSCDIKKYLIFELNCFLDQGRIVLKNSGFECEFYKEAKSKYFSGYRELWKIKCPFNTNYKRNFMVGAVSHLSYCIQNNRNSISSGADGLAALKIIEAAMHSAKNDGRKVIIS